MEIVRRDNARVCTIDELSNGDVFELDITASAIFVKTESIKTKGDALYNALRVDNGKHVFVAADEKIRELNAKLVIEPLPVGVEE